jgi:hypothetical protein
MDRNSSVQNSLQVWFEPPLETGGCFLQSVGDFQKISAVYIALISFHAENIPVRTWIVHPPNTITNMKLLAKRDGIANPKTQKPVAQS